MMPAPTARQLAELRAAAHRDVDAIIDALPAINEAAKPARRPVHRAYGTVADPTAADVFHRSPARTWVMATQEDFRRLATRVAQIETVIGPGTCTGCSKPLGKRGVTEAAGSLYHDACLTGQKAA